MTAVSRPGERPDARPILSLQGDEDTARTRAECAAQRAEHLAALGARRVLELCVGPSLRELELAYAERGLTCAGCDVDPRWRTYYPTGSWLVGDALEVSWRGFDCVVFAPPLSRGCTGRREDALRVVEVRPRYLDFLRRLAAEPQGVDLAALVLPGRSTATRRDRSDLHALLALAPGAEVIPLCAGRRRTTKYHDIYLRPRLLARRLLGLGV